MRCKKRLCMLQVIAVVKISLKCLVYEACVSVCCVLRSTQIYIYILSEDCFSRQERLSCLLFIFCYSHLKILESFHFQNDSISCCVLCVAKKIKMVSSTMSKSYILFETICMYQLDEIIDYIRRGRNIHDSMIVFCI